jgi:hypothetical protein
VHDGNLAGRPAEADAAELEPEAQGLAEGNGVRADFRAVNRASVDGRLRQRKGRLPGL